MSFFDMESVLPLRHVQGSPLVYVTPKEAAFAFL